MSKNPDYTESAVNLKQPALVGKCLVELHDAQIAAAAARAVLQDTLEFKTVATCDNAVANITGILREAIDEHGSWQDPIVGAYAVKQCKVTMVYSPSMVKSRLPELAGDIITVTEAVDKKVIERLVKDGFTTEEAVNQCGRPRESFVYIIATGNGGGEDAPRD